jgi:hypothetical protein
MKVLQGVASLSLGFLFGLGLTLAGMINPQKVQDFLDFTGRWDPSLAVVMASALFVTLITFPFILRRTRPVIGHKFHVPTTTTIDRRLVLGSALFGVGWGLGGFCPGPALVAVATGSRTALIFLVSMLLGMALHRTYHDLRSPAH